MKPGKLALGLFGFHFLLILLGVLHVSLPGHFLAHAQRNYSRVAGAGGSYAFFSPNVSRELDVRFTIRHPDGTETKTTLQEMNLNEVRMRLGNMIRLLERHYQNEKILRSVAASLSAYVYRKFPDAVSVTLDAYVFELPAMAEFRSGKPIESKRVYSATFGKRGAA